MWVLMGTLPTNPSWLNLRTIIAYQSQPSPRNDSIQKRVPLSARWSVQTQICESFLTIELCLKCSVVKNANGGIL
jgi:hypothetical protein